MTFMQNNFRLKSLTSSKTKIFGLIGNPVQHSFSPRMHNAGFRKLGLDAHYLAFRVVPEQLENAINGVRRLNIAGLNVTVPHKSTVIPFLDEVHPHASKIGAVNTIINLEGRLIGTSTDSSGFIRSLEEQNVYPKGKSIVILGAGGSARSLLSGLSETGASQIRIWNRTLSKAEALISEFSSSYIDVELKALTEKNLDNIECDLLINTTSCGMRAVESPFNLLRAKSISYVVDIIYNPSRTLLLNQATKLGIANHNGLGMLLYQGCESFKYWTGQNAPSDVMRQELISQLNPNDGII